LEGVSVGRGISAETLKTLETGKEVGPFSSLTGAIEEAPPCGVEIGSTGDSEGVLPTVGDATTESELWFGLKI
jgi:hypothetical protein